MCLRTRLFMHHSASLLCSSRLTSIPLYAPCGKSNRKARYVPNLHLKIRSEAVVPSYCQRESHVREPVSTFAPTAGCRSEARDHHRLCPIFWNAQREAEQRSKAVCCGDQRFQSREPLSRPRARQAHDDHCTERHRELSERH